MFVAPDDWHQAVTGSLPAHGKIWPPGPYHVPRDLAARPRRTAPQKSGAPPVVSSVMNSLHAAICAHDSAQLRQASAQSSNCSPPIASQLSAHRVHTSAHTAQVRRWRGEPRNMKFALVWQISAQSSKSLMCSGEACLPPISRQCWTVCKQMR